jgi:hypothetical protein
MRVVWTAFQAREEKQKRIRGARRTIAKMQCPPRANTVPLFTQLGPGCGEQKHISMFAYAPIERSLLPAGFAIFRNMAGISSDRAHMRRFWSNLSCRS